MSGPFARLLAAALASSVTAACAQDNPFFVLSGADTATTTASTSTPGTSGEFGTSTTQSGADSSTLPTTSTDEPGTATSMTSSSTDPIDTGTSTGEPPPDTTSGAPLDTGEPPFEVVTVLATVATCVLLPILDFQLLYIGPDGCETLSSVSDGVPDIGVMVLDTGFLPASGRESRIYLSFDIPAPPPGLALTGATLVVDASSSPDSGAAWSGDLYLSDESFTAMSLQTFAPAGAILTPNPGPSAPNQPSLWQIPVEVLIANQPIYLGLGAKDTDGVQYRSGAAPNDKKPRLQLLYEG